MTYQEKFIRLQEALHPDKSENFHPAFRNKVFTECKSIQELATAWIERCETLWPAIPQEFIPNVTANPLDLIQSFYNQYPSILNQRPLK